MNQRDLSERLEQLADKLEALTGRMDDCEVAYEVADELRKLSNENYAPGNGVSWKDVAPKSTKKTYTQGGKRTPF